MMSNAAKLSCWSAVAGAALMIIGFLTVTIAGYNTHALDVNAAQSFGFIGANFVVAAGSILVLYGLPGIYARWSEGWGRVGLAGIALSAFFLMIFGVFGSLLTAIVSQWIAVKAPSLITDPGPTSLYVVIGLATLAMFGALITMAIPMLRNRVAAPWVGYGLIASTALFVLGFAFAGSMTKPNVFAVLVVAAAEILATCVLGYLGYLGATATRAVRTEPGVTRQSQLSSGGLS